MNRAAEQSVLHRTVERRSVLEHSMTKMTGHRTIGEINWGELVPDMLCPKTTGGPLRL